MVKLVKAAESKSGLSVYSAQKRADLSIAESAPVPLWIQQERLKVPAQVSLRAAVARGDLVRPATCENCGKPCKAQGHHDDYRNPLTVRWLCQRCHNLAHKRQPWLAAIEAAQ